MEETDPLHLSVCMQGEAIISPYLGGVVFRFFIIIISLLLFFIFYIL